MPGVYRAAIHGIARYHYTPEQLRAWATLTPSVAAFRNMYGDGRYALVIDGEGRGLLGFADVEADGHVGMFYCRPEISGTGIAGELYRALEAESRRLGIAALRVEASETAVGFFQRQGFSRIRRNDLRVNGVDIHNYSMTKTLG